MSILTRSGILQGVHARKLRVHLLVVADGFLSSACCAQPPRHLGNMQHLQLSRLPCCLQGCQLTTQVLEAAGAAGAAARHNRQRSGAAKQPQQQQECQHMRFVGFVCVWHSIIWGHRSDYSSQVTCSC